MAHQLTQQIAVLSTALMSFIALADGKSAEQDDNKYIDIISIIGQSQQLKQETGSAYALTKAQLEQFEYDDIHRILQSVPGVYLREEDGYGLRPNIGIRGATTERSSKITIMEDGVLIAPAPYAAPAAYYFPNTARMTGIEVLKGPAAINYGPNTVGGAINMQSRAIDDETSAHLELAYGMDNYQKLHSYYNYQADQFGLLVEGIHLASDGFKALDNGDNTGFVKNELLLKANYEITRDTSYQLWQFKVGYGDELSHETYLGLTEADFQQQPNRRYLASQDDLMDWQHTQLQLSHYIEFNDNLSLHTQVYRRDFQRDWGKINRFNTNRSIQTILLSPDTGLNKRYYDVLTGVNDSQSSAETLMYGHNDREYFSQGIQTKLLLQQQHFGSESELELGLRLHRDQVIRNHYEDGFLMQQGQLIASGDATLTTLNNKETVDALALHINYKLIFDQLTLTTGLRMEDINGDSLDMQALTHRSNSDKLLSPGVGAFYRINDNFGLLAGINKGFVPNSPGQAEGIKAEESWNYEYGFRYADAINRGELVAFITDYKNLKGQCTFSSGCIDNISQEFNGGEVLVQGVEASFNTQWTLTDAINLPLAINYTYTHSEFKTAFSSSFIQWGSVSKGDALPYMPNHQWSVETGLAGENWQLEIIAKHVDKMQETAGGRTELEGYWTQAINQIDISAWLQVTQQLKIYGKLDNATNQQTIVSRRPLGARASKPRQLIVGIKYDF